jgi:hypothetical protein
MLGRRVGDRHRARRIGRDRTVVDDAATLRTLVLHHAERFADAVERAVQVGLDHLLPLLDRQLVDRHRRRAHAGVVEHQVHAAEALDRGVEQRRNLRGLRHVGRHRERALGDVAERVAGLGNRLLQCIGPAAGEGHAPAVGDQRLRAGSADARTGAGDDRDAVVGCLGGGGHLAGLLATNEGVCHCRRSPTPRQVKRTIG